jgi:flavin reductase (DIM6/NTAB) family NADH-FMN oxidoreductase RutF
MTQPQRWVPLRETDAQQFRSALGCFATGVTIVTARGLGPGEYIGITVNSFASVSLDPPLVLFSLGKRNFSLQHFLSTRHFAVNVLSGAQRELALRFARSAVDKWNGVEFELWEHDCPIFPDAAAVFECTIHHTYQGGDHVILVGHVEHMLCNPQAEPLLFLRGRYGTFAEDR